MCTSVIVGNKATRNGISIIARNEDFDTNICNKHLKFRPTPEYIDPVTHQHDPRFVANGKWTLGNGLSVPVPTSQFSYSAMPDANAYQEATHAIGERFFFEERGFNQNRVAISATNSMEDPNDKALSADPFVPVGIEESIIPTLILPQATSAKQAVALLGDYVETYGASEGNGVLFGDINESWYMEIGSGHHWIAVRVPENQYLVVANSKRIHDVDLTSADTLHSKELFAFTCQHALLDNPVETNFDFAQAFGQLGLTYSTDRVWLGQLLLTPSLKQRPRLPQYPLFLAPDTLVPVEKIMSLLRSNYSGTELEDVAQRPIGVIRTAESHIMTLDGSLPEPLQCVIWQSVSSPLDAPYFPILQPYQSYPSAYQLGNKEYTQTSAYWMFKGLFALDSVNGGVNRLEPNKEWQTLERQLLNEHPSYIAAWQQLYATSPQSAEQAAANYSAGVSNMLVETAQSMYSAMLTEMVSKMEDPHEIRQ